MKISVKGYGSFKSVVSTLGSPSAVFYCQTSGEVFKILSLISGTSSYVQADLTTGNATVSQLITDYPSAVEVTFDISGAF
jgi:hypothetical protein